MSSTTSTRPHRFYHKIHHLNVNLSKTIVEVLFYVPGDSRSMLWQEMDHILYDLVKFMRFYHASSPEAAQHRHSHPKKIFTHSSLAYSMTRASEQKIKGSPVSPSPAMKILARCQNHINPPNNCILMYSCNHSCPHAQIPVNNFPMLKMCYGKSLCQGCMLYAHPRKC